MLRVATTSARALTDDEADALFSEGFPAFITADHEVKKHIGRVRELFADLDIVLTTEDDVPVATGWGVPIAWTGEVDDLPVSFADCLRRAVVLHDAAGTPDTSVVCGGVVHPAHKGSGVAAALLSALRDDAHDLPRVIAPVRPTRKHLYPLTGIATYASWVRDDGLPWDPWLRLHVRVGGRVVGLLPESQTMTGTVAQWSQWAGLDLPGSGDFVIDQGLSPLRVDVDRDQGTYVEPNVWVRHR